MKTAFIIKNNTIHDLGGHTIGSIKEHSILDSFGVIKGTFSEREIFNSHRNLLAIYDDQKILNPKFEVVSHNDNVRKIISGADGITLAAIWVLFFMG